MRRMHICILVVSYHNFVLGNMLQMAVCKASFFLFGSGMGNSK